MRAHALRSRDDGFTLVELIVVLVILVVLGTLVVSAIDDTVVDAQQTATEATFDSTRAAILGTATRLGGPSYHGDVRRWPATIADLLRQPAGVPDYDPLTHLGWRGPYLATSTGFYSIDLANGFEPLYGLDHDPALLDSWSRPIVLQIPDLDGVQPPSDDELRHMRLVSAGLNGRIDTPRTVAATAPPGTVYFPSLAQCDDDLVLYLRVADLRP